MSSVKVSTGLLNHVLAVGSLKHALADGFIDIYAGDEPATANASVGAAVKLCRISKDGLGDGINLDTTAVNGVLVKAPGELWRGTNLASGTPSFYRYVTAADDGSASTTAPRIQGRIGQGGASINILASTLTAGAPQDIEAYAVAWPTL
jgi:hypothetical protein